VKTQFNRKYILAIIILGASCALILGIALLLPGFIERKIHAIISEQNINAGSVHVELFSRSVELNNLEWESQQDSQKLHIHSFKINTLNIRGINLYELLAKKNIRINEIVLDSGKIKYNTKKTSQQQHDVLSLKYKELTCAFISLIHIETEIISDTVEMLTTIFHLNITDLGVKMDSTNSKIYTMQQMDGFAENINFNRNEGMYGSSIKKIAFNTAKQEITIDSILLIPNFSKFKFARYIGKQAGRLSISVPKLIFEGVAFEYFQDSIIDITKIRIPAFDLHSFKDKRMPYLNTEIIPLPMEVFIDLPWQIKIDSILIGNSLITIEEFPEKGDELTLVTFTNVNAAFTGLNNRITKDDRPYALLHATGNLMGSANINALFRFPLDGSPTYSAAGKVSNFSLAELNPVFVPIASIRIESGFLNTLKFDFDYNEFNSKGTLDIDYEDLRLVVLNKRNAQNNQVKTFIINLLVKKNRDQSGQSAKTVGEIDIERDRSRYIFNVWWKSVLDGLQYIMKGGTS